MHEIPQGAPTALFDAFAYIAQRDDPSIDDLKIMVMVEAAGVALYAGLADGVEQEDVKALLHRNGREELAHAHRVARAIGKLTGTEYAVPADDENPYLVTPIPRKPVTQESLTALAEAEVAGDALYERWASNCANPEAAALFRQNGREENQHGDRLRQAAALLPA